MCKLEQINNWYNYILYIAHLKNIVTLIIQSMLLINIDKLENETFTFLRI